MRPIDAERLKDSIKKLEAESPDIKTARIIDRTIQEIFPQIIDDEPTIEAEPVKHGKWERHTNFAGNYYTCTVCKNVAREMPECMGEPIYEFCPYCGARMDGGAD